MTPGLNECLRAAGLQHYYARFTSVGVHHAAHLSALTIEDYPILGIHTMEDRTRLFHLVQMVKSLDLEALRYEDGDDYDTDGGDEGYAPVDGSFIYGGYGDPDEDLYDGEDERRGTMNESNVASFTRSSHVRRRLDFSCENAGHHQKLLSYEDGPVHACTSHDRNYRVQNKENHDHRRDGHSRPSNHHTGGNIKPNIIGGTATTLSPKLASFHEQKPRSATVASKKFVNKPGGHKDRRRISKKEISLNMAKPTLVYESKRTAGYNYGVPQSFHPASNKKQEGKQQISVCVRKRPLTHAESRRGEADVVTTSGEECVIVHESKEAVDLTQYILKHRFYFDKVFGEERSNEEVYQQTAYPLVQHMLNGGKATCFAYGQTGAGKTHTMLGSSPGRPGLYALAVRDIFAHLSSTRVYSALLVYVSFFEIYCGQLYDLLDHRKRLFAREDGQKVVHIAGLRNVRVDSVSSLLEVISQGTEERTQGTSGVNPHSSRSHALLQIQLRCPNQQIAGRMWFVDLAGSERASDTKEPDRQSRMEAAEINQSLLALKECIRSLDQEQSHTPFRQSKLTQVLKDSFVGDSMTCMIANISPGHFATEHTLNTLRYADRVKELRGQGGLRGGRRSKTLPSPKHNLSSSSGSIVRTRGKSPHKKQKLERQREAFTPTTPDTRSAAGDAVLCSTPKSSRWKAETNARHNKGIGLEHITPIRGWLAVGDKSHGQEGASDRKDRRRESETHGRTNSHFVGDQNTTDTNLLGAHKSLAQRESDVHHRQEENQHHTVKTERQEERRWRNQLRQMESNRDTSSEVERLRERDFKKEDEWNKEKQRHLQQYHLQLQQFSPLTVPPSVNLLSPSTCPSLSSTYQASLSSHVSPLSSSSLQHSSHSSAPALMYHSLEELLNAYRAGAVVKSEHNKRQSSFHLQTETSASCNNNNDDGGDCGGAGEDCVVSWEGKEIKYGQRSESDERGGAVGAPAEALVRKEERRRPAGMEGEQRRWAWVATTEQADTMTGATRTNVVTQVSHNCQSDDRGHVGEQGVDSSGFLSLVSIPDNNDSNGLFNHPPFEPPHRRAPAERPLSPTCEHINALPMPNTKSDSNHTHCPKANMSDLRQDETLPSNIMSPLSISLLQVDQQAATASFLTGEHNTTSLSERGKGSRREVEKEHHMCSGIAEKVVENEDVELRLSLLELPQPKTNCPPTFESMPAVHHTERGQGRTKPPMRDVMHVSLQHQDNSQDQTVSAAGKVKSIPPIVHRSVVTVSSCSLPNGATQIPTEYTNKMHNETAKASVSAAQSEHVLGQYHTAHSNSYSNSNTSLQPKSPAEAKSQESRSNHQIQPIMHLSALEDLDYAQWHIVQAHWEQLEEMEDLRHREGTLLCQQPDMAFREYVHKLEEIMERKAWCIRSMRAQLQPYLKPVHFNQSSNQSE